jgi:hypothetical protein
MYRARRGGQVDSSFLYQIGQYGGAATLLSRGGNQYTPRQKGMQKKEKDWVLESCGEVVCSRQGLMQDYTLRFCQKREKTFSILNNKNA